MTAFTSYPLFCLAVCACALLPGCDTSSTQAPASGRYVVSAPKSQFYKYGPAQPFGADFALPRGQRVTMVERAFGFSRVTTEDGQTGYVPTDDLAPAPPEPAATLTLRQTASRRGRGHADAPYTGTVRKTVPPQREEGATPLFDVYDVPLPTDPDRPHPAETKTAPATPAPKAN
ncbi:MAG: hypothetical protein QOE70_2632 [Chthoniobacter sp.]|jgi:hypothetical protein|nr:hypothetical protein [Chthoniobacter sp.]